MKISKDKILILLVCVLAIPTFFRMLRPGIYSMQDPHVFRLYEFDKCIKDFQIPCRWSPDSAHGYGEPLFNFYTRVPFIVGEAFHLIGFQIIDSTKIAFALSLVFSAITMFTLGKYLWKNNNSALLSAILYIYAPYRALDVWVRAALPEAWAFVFFPLIILFALKFMDGGKKINLFYLSLCLSMLILTHNLSLFMFIPTLAIFLAFKIFESKSYKRIFPMAISAIGAVALSSYYLLPVIFETKFINLDSTIQGYFDFRGHFAGFSQLLFSRYWGYGASLFGPDDRLSLSVGQVQWIIPILGIILLTFSKKSEVKDAVVLTILGWFALFLTHNKSAQVWEHIKPMWYLQFPWRFLSIATFCFSLAGGAMALVFARFKYITWVILGVVIATNLSFFREDLWFKISDKEQFSGAKWEEQQASSIGDYWPVFAKTIPVLQATKNALSDEGFVGKEIGKTTNKASYIVNLDKESEVQFPIAYFPGWIASVNSNRTNTYPTGEFGLVTAKLPEGENQNIVLNFTNTPIRTTGNLISLVSIAVFGLLFKKHA